MTLKELQEKLNWIQHQGFIPSMRRGSTGIGYTFETLLKIDENNLPIPDIGGRVEIKTIRKDSQSLITLFTFNKAVWKLPQRELIFKYGYKDTKGRYALKNTIFYNKPITQGLAIEIDKDKNVIHLIDSFNNEILATWDVYVIVGKFMSKLSRTLIVLADRKVEKGTEYFHYNEAYLLTDPSARKFISAFEQGVIGIDLRMHLKENSAVRNRGTAFRIKEKDLIQLYENQRKIL